MKSAPLPMSAAVAALALAVSCGTAVSPGGWTPLADPALVEPAAPDTFLANCAELRDSGAFRQNVHLVVDNDGIASICMDRHRRLYLAIHSPRRRAGRSKFESLLVSKDWLRSEMDQDAVVPDTGEAAAVYKIPADASETFAAELLNEVGGTHVEPADIVFQWD